MKRLVLAPLVGAVAFSVSISAWAKPEGHGALVAGIGSLGREDGPLVFPAFSGALRGELWFLRERDADFGFGPFAGLSTAAFEHYGAAAGLSFVLPLNSTYPFILSVAAGALSQHPGWSPSVEGWLFWGPSSHNFHSSYAMASGLLLGYQQGLGERRVTIISLAAQLDLGLVALPFIALEQWVAGG